jgi:SPP1 gp7 family putative phage head morphogenesis protein
MNSREKYLKQHREYIKKRELEHIKNKITDDKKYRAELQKMYNSTQDEIQRRLERLYIRYAKSEGITIDEAMKLADKTDVEKFVNRVKEYVKNKDFSKRANDELKLYNLKMRMSRLELMKHEILIEQMRLSGKETDMLYGRLKDDLIEETRRQAGILGLDPDFYEDFIRNSDAIINGDFKSANFSDRIWANGYKMRGNLQSGIHNSMLLGDNPRTWARKLEENLSEEMDDTGKQNAFYNAFRLAVTESARVQVNTGLNLMRKSGYEKYMWIAEPGACHICAPFNNHVFDIENSDIGDELPPMHPFCRCSIAAYYNIDEEQDSGYNIDEIEKTEHAEKRREERNVSDDDVSDALNEPLYVGDLEIDKNGRPSRKYVGKNATVVINPDTNKEITSWRTSSRLRKKFEKGGK